MGNERQQQAEQKSLPVIQKKKKGMRNAESERELLFLLLKSYF